MDKDIFLNLFKSLVRPHLEYASSDMVNKEKLFTMSQYTGKRGHSFKIYKKRFRLNIRGNYFSNRVVGQWNELQNILLWYPLSIVLRVDLISVGMGIAISSTPGAIFPANGQDIGKNIQIRVHQ